MKVMAVFDGIPAQLSRHEKRYRITSLGKNARMRDYRMRFFGFRMRVLQIIATNLQIQMLA